MFVTNSFVLSNFDYGQNNLNKQEKHMTLVFNTADINKDGIISKKELKKYFGFNGKQYKSYNLDKEKGLTYAEFVNLMKTEQNNIKNAENKLHQQNITEKEKAQLIDFLQSKLFFEDRYKNPPIADVKYPPYEK